MGRDIKFRAWHKNNKSMCQNATTDLLERDYLEFMQYVGLKDKNGKDIYEGDILHSSNDGKYEVVWYNCGFATKWLANNSECYLIKGFADITEVVGNIYENPELLE